ncbi:phosphoribosyltransferase family protein [Amycolatopsis sp. H20-H5]|uniref:phosphoribosyltransferase family protein n=1 Tax=Amycolatopsis sp. H20-H5 TaxID=3046309 RepID=UPI002DBD4CBF|nr:phosphoribosyltransferase family protein [Amycolatopsis sp. H20-H5]MEC3980840.1 phosphoribosyltransferase family protein [Amycolatopsis sp. H20-H5]
MTTPTSTSTNIRLGYRAQRVERLGVEPGMRDERIVHELDGMLAAVKPARLETIGRDLWSAWTADPGHGRPDLLLGLDAGGIPPTMALALAADLPYRLAWKLDLALPHKQKFAEPHARRTDVFTYAEFAGLRLLVVDDEITTGHTAANLVAMLRAAGAVVAGIVCLVEDSTGGGRARLAEIGVPLCTLTTL